jgi:predicted tellurium resistance membrane protein TerC
VADVRQKNRFRLPTALAPAFSACMFAWLSDPNAWISLLTLTVLEIVLGVDNIIFISIIAGKLPPEQQGKARNLGLMLALLTRILLLCGIFLLTKLTKELFSVFGQGFTGKDLVMLFGGLFLIAKSVKEIHHSVEGEDHSSNPAGAPKMATILWTIVFVDVIFSLDSVITAVGLVGSPTQELKPGTIEAARAAFAPLSTLLGNASAPEGISGALQGMQTALGHAETHAAHGNGPISIMISAIVLSMIVMLAAAKTISDFVNRHPTVKMLALSFLILVGFVLVADGLGHHVPKGYIYVAMAFSFIVEVLNIQMRKKKTAAPVHLRSKY